MTTFRYSARDMAGRSVSGTLQASSQEEAAVLLRKEGKYPVRIDAVDPVSRSAEGRSKGGIRIRRAEVIQIATQLSVMIEAGVTLSDALDAIARQTDRPRTRELVEDLLSHVQAGVSFSEALSRHPGSFSRLFIALIRASEKSGMMSVLLMRVVQYLRDEQETRRRVKGALVYPLIMFGFAVSVTVFLLAVVLPRFTAIYASKKAALPAPTQVLMTASDLLINNWPGIVAGLIVAVVSAWGYCRTAAGQRLLHRAQISLPLLGPLLRKLHLSRGLRAVGTLAGAGVSLGDCINTACELSANSHYRALWQGVWEQVHAGKQVSEPLFNSPLVPRAVAQMIASGEKSGRLGSVMEQVAGFSEQELKEQVAVMTRYIEPVMIVAMGLIIGGVSLALLLPIFTISRVMTSP